MTTPVSNVSNLFKKINFQAVSPKRATLVLVIFLGLLGGVAWVMIADKEQYLVQRNFRLLNLWSQETRAKIASYKKVFETAAPGIAVNGEVTLHSHRTELETDPQRALFLTTGHTKNNENKIKMVDSWECPLQGVPSSSDPESFLHGHLCAEGVTEIQLKQRSTELPNEEDDQLTADPSKSSPTIQVVYTKSSGKNEVNILGTVDLSKFFTHLTSKSPFEEVLVFQSSEKEFKNSTLIFHTGTREFFWRNYQEITDRKISSSFLGNLLGSQDDSGKNAAALSLPPGPNRFLIEVPGNKYEVFSHPFTVPGQNGTHWNVIGLVSHKTFQSSYLAISSTILVGMMFLVLGLAFGIPLFHLKMMGHSDPLRSSHVLALVLSALLGTGLLTYLFLDISLYWEAKQTLKNHLKTSSQTIKTSLFDELERILVTLKELDDNPRLDEDYDKISQQTWQPVGDRAVLMEDKMKNPCGPSGLIQSDRCYPDFLYAFWMDEDGSLRINWVREGYDGVGENLPLIGRDYTRMVLEHPTTLLGYPQASNLNDQKNEFQFYLEPIISWNSGLNTVVASMASRLKTKNQSWVAAMEFKFLSLMDDVVLPPGIGFAVLDDKKDKVLFHSDESRNLREDFIVETDHNPALKNLLSSKIAGHAKGSYWGNATSFYTQPLHPLPWSLVVYRNNEMLRSVNLVGLLIAGTLYGLWSIFLYFGVWLLLKRPSIHRKAPWLWPTPDHHPHYVHLLKWNIALFILGAISVYLLSGFPLPQLMIALLAIPPIGLAGGFWIIHKKVPEDQTESSDQDQEIRHNNRLGSFRKSYASLASSILLIFAVLPAFACFSSVFHLEMRLFSQFQLVEIFKSIENSHKIHHLQKSTIPQNHAESNICPQPAASLSKHVLNSEGIQRPSGIYPDFFLTTKWSICENPQGFSEETSPYFHRLFALLSQPFLPLLKHTSLWGFIGASWPSQGDETDNISKQREIIWETPPTHTSLFSTMKGEGSTYSSNPAISESSTDSPTTPETPPTYALRISAPFPIQLWHLTGSVPHLESVRLEHLLGYPLMAFAFFSWLFLIPKFIANRTVFLSYTPQAPFPLEAIFHPEYFGQPSNRLVLGFPGQGKTPMASMVNSTHSCVIHLDLKTIPPDKWRSTLFEKLREAETENVKHVYLILDHLEYQWKNPSCNMKKLEFIETLLHRHSSSLDSEKAPPGEKQKLVIEVRDIQPDSVSTKIVPPTFT